MSWRDGIWRARNGFVVLGMTATLLWSGTRASASESVSAEATKYFTRGLAAVEMAKVPVDYDVAIEEFMKAQALAPDWPDVYYNLGVVQEKAGKFKEAADSLNTYLLLAPNAPDAQSIKNIITRLEFKAEQTITDEVALDIFGSLGYSNMWEVKGSTSEDSPERIRWIKTSKRDGRQIIITYESGVDSNNVQKTETMRVTPNGKNINFTTIYYMCRRSNQEDECPEVTRYKLEIVSKKYVKMVTKKFAPKIAGGDVYDHSYEIVRKY